jgi:hypothetical protein
LAFRFPFTAVSTEFVGSGALMGDEASTNCFFDFRPAVLFLEDLIKGLMRVERRREPGALTENGFFGFPFPRSRSISEFVVGGTNILERPEYKPVANLEE